MTSWCGKRSLYSFTCGESHQLCEFISSKHHIANWYDVLLLISFYAYTSHDVLFISILLSIFLHFHSFPLPSGIHTATENDHNTIWWWTTDGPAQLRHNHYIRALKYVMCTPSKHHYYLHIMLSCKSYYIHSETSTTSAEVLRCWGDDTPAIASFSAAVIVALILILITASDDNKM